jgi:hypothetical protein
LFSAKEKLVKQNDRRNYNSGSCDYEQNMVDSSGYFSPVVHKRFAALFFFLVLVEQLDRLPNQLEDLFQESSAHAIYFDFVASRSFTQLFQ